MKSRYQEMFDEVRASGTLQTEVLQMRNQENGTRARRRLPVAGLAAAVLAVVLVAGTALAVASPSLRDWFAREWAERTGGNISENQALLIDSLTQKVGESQTVGDVTVTVDSIAAGGENVWVLLEAEGVDFKKNQVYTFLDTDVELIEKSSGKEPGNMSAYSVGSIGVTESGAVRMLLEYATTIPSREQINAGGYEFRFTLQDLGYYAAPGDSDYTVLGEGEWSFSIPLTVECLSPVITIDSVFLPDMEEPEILHDTDGEVEYAGMQKKDITLRDIQITSTGLSFVVGSSATLNVEAILSDGTEVLSSAGGGTTLEDGSMYCTNQWPVPLDVEDIVALRIGRMEIPVPQASE